MNSPVGLESDEIFYLRLVNCDPCVIVKGGKHFAMTRIKFYDDNYDGLSVFLSSSVCLSVCLSVSSTTMWLTSHFTVAVTVTVSMESISVTKDVGTVQVCAILSQDAPRLTPSPFYFYLVPPPWCYIIVCSYWCWLRLHIPYNSSVWFATCTSLCESQLGGDITDLTDNWSAVVMLFQPAYLLHLGLIHEFQYIWQLQVTGLNMCILIPH